MADTQDKNSSPSRTESMAGAIGSLERSLEESLRRQLQEISTTPARDDLSAIYDFDDKILSQEELAEIVDGHTPLFADDEFAFYRIGGRLIIAPIQFINDRADELVREAGFATEPLRYCLNELYECLWTRMMEDPYQQPFTEREWRACEEARELLGFADAEEDIPPG